MINDALYGVEAQLNLSRQCGMGTTCPTAS